MRKIASVIIAILVLLVFASCGQEPAPVPSVQEVSLDYALRTALVNDEFTLHATVIADEGADTTVTWTSSDESVATVDSDGKVTAKVADKKAFIYATAGDKRADCLLMILPEIVPVESVSIDRPFSFMTEGSKIKLNAIVTPDDATFENVTWSSSDETVAKVSADGEVTALKEGAATISATATAGKTGECTLIVLSKPVPVESITLDKHFTAITLGSTVTIKATVNPEDATYYKVIWKSSNEKVVTVNNGVLTGVGEGTATITANVGDKYTMCVVVVSKDTVKVTYDANDGSGKTWKQDIPINHKTKLAEVMFSRKDYVFTGWNTKKDYTGDMFFDGETVEFSDDVTLYAQWIWHDLFIVNEEGELKQGGGFAAHCIDLHDNVCLPKTIGGKHVKAIGKELFLNCECGSIREIKIPEGVTDIQFQAFHDCHELHWLHIPASVNNHDATAFSACWNMRFKVHPDNARYTTDDDGNMLLSKDKTILYAWPTCSDPAGIPEGIVEIGASAFQYSGLSGTLVLPKSVKRIGYNAFLCTDNLRELHVKGSLESIGKNAFASNVEGGVGLQSAVFDGDVGTIGEYALSANWLSSVEFKGNVKQMDYGAFGMAMAGTVQGLTVKIRGNGDPAKLDPTALAGAWFASIQVPTNLVDKYKAADVWSTKADYIRPLED